MSRLALALLIVIPFTLQAQSESGRGELTRAIAAYQNLDFDVAATTLRRALERELSVSERIEALTYLGAAEHYRARPDSARAVFHRLILLAPPGFQLDTLVFPPEVTHAFEDVRLAVRDSLRQPSLAQVTPPPPPRPPAAKADTTRPLPARPTQSHRGIVISGRGVVANVRAHSEGGLPSASGMALGAAGAARFGRFELGIEYLEGSLDTRDLVEGAAALRFVTTPWLTLHAGPYVRHYDSSLGGGAERWMMWQLGARAEAPIAGTSVRGHAMLWQGLGLSVNVPTGAGTARGGELGATLMTSGPFRFGIAYSFDHASVHGASRSETVHTVLLTAGVRTP